MRLAMTQHGLRQSFICEPYHILRVLKESQGYMQGRNAEVEYLSAGMRRNGFLSWRPDFVSGTLRRADEAEWAKAFPEGYQRICKQWFEDRYSWLDEEGIPQGPDCQASEDATETAAAIESEYCAHVNRKELERSEDLP